MASNKKESNKKENIKALFKNTRTRIIIIFTVLIVLTAGAIGFLKFHKAMNPLGASSDVNRTPGGIESIPGALNQTAQYAALQEQQNREQAEQAQAEGKSSIPTIIRAQAFGEGVESVGATGGQGSVGFSTLARANLGGPQSTLWFQNLKDTNCSKESVNKAVNENNATMKELKLACTCQQLKLTGYGLADLKPICSCEELKAIGFGIEQFKAAGYDAQTLKNCGFVACDEHRAGFTVQQMKDAGYSDGELKGAGFTEQEIARAGGLPSGISEDDVRKAGCTVENLKRLRASGVTAAAIKRISGCSAAALKAAGFSAQDLKNAGFSAAELKDAGFSAEELAAAGYSARALLDAGFTPDELLAVGFSPSDIAAAETMLPPGVSIKDIASAGCSPEAIKRQRLAGISAEMIKKIAKCSPSQLMAGGFTASDLLRAGFSPAQLGAGETISDEDIKSGGCDPKHLKALLAKGVSAKRIRELNGCSLAALKAAGFDAAALADAGFTPEELLAAGFSPEDLKKAGVALASVSDEEIKKGGCDPKHLKALFAKGVSAKRIRELNGCSLDALKAAGFDAAALANAGFSPAELLAAGFSAEDLKNAGVALAPAGIIAAGRTADCSVESLKAARAAGISAATIKKTLGCSAEAMKAAGFTAAELKEAGFSAAELKNAGFSAADLKAAGFSAKDLRAAGFSAADLKNLGFSAADLKDAGFSAADLKAAGFSAADLKAAGFSASDLKAAGFTADELHKAGYSAKELKDAGFSAVQLKNAGLSSAEIVAAGVSQQESALAGLETVAPITPKPGEAIAAIPSFRGAARGSAKQAAAMSAENAKHLDEILARQKSMQVDQRFQQKIQQRASGMTAAVTQIMQSWKGVTAQQYVAGTAKEEKGSETGEIGPDGKPISGALGGEKAGAAGAAAGEPIVRMGDILFAVIDTSVNTDEPGPILATIVAGKLKGGKLIGSFNLPPNADKMVISFNSLSMPGTPKTWSINAFAVDPNTARTALSSETDHHYLSRYGALFASTFLEGFGNAFQSANTTITVGGTGGNTNTTVQNGIGRSALENAVIGLATVGKAWGQVAQQNMSRPTTVQIYSGTAVGVLFTQDLRPT